jgi:hypothetical protein
MHVVGVTCSGCEMKLFVMYREVFVKAEALWGKRVEVEVAGMESNALFAVADPARFYTCPGCAARGWLPPAEELFL